MDGTPVGRRVFLGLLGVGAAGIVLGSNVERWLERQVGPYLAKDGTLKWLSLDDIDKCVCPEK